MRVAFVLRSAEVQPLFLDLCDVHVIVSIRYMIIGIVNPPPPNVLVSVVLEKPERSRAKSPLLSSCFRAAICLDRHMSRQLPYINIPIYMVGMLNALPGQTSGYLSHFTHTQQSTIYNSVLSRDLYLYLCTFSRKICPDSQQTHQEESSCSSCATKSKMYLAIDSPQQLVH